MSKPTGFEGIDPNQPQSIIRAIPDIAAGRYGAALLGLAAIGAYHLYSKRGAGNKRLKGSAYWADRSHMAAAKRLMVADTASGELGRLSYPLGNLPLYDVITSLLTFGAPKSGKSYGVTNQAIYAHMKRGKPQVIVDLQYPTQTKLFVPIAQELGVNPKDIHLFVPGEKASGIWNIVEYAQGSRAMEMTSMLQANVEAKDAKVDAFFGPAGQFAIAGTMGMCRHIPELADLIGCQAFLGLEELPSRLIAEREKLMKIDPWAYNQFTQFLSTAKSEKTAASIVGAAQNLFGRFASEDIAPSITGKTTIPLYLEGQKLLIIGCTKELRATTAPIIMALLSLVSMVNAVDTRKDELQIAIDEFPAVKYPSLIEQANEDRKFNIYFNLAAQSINQVRKAFSREDTENLLTAAGTKAWFNPRSNDSAEYLQKSLGTKRYRTTEYSHGYGGGRSNSNRSSQIRERPLFSAHEISKLKQGMAIVQTRGPSSKTEEYIPLKIQLKPSPEYMSLVKQAEACWPFTQKQLNKFSPQIKADGYSLLTAYASAAEALLPSVPSKAEQDAVKKVEGERRDDF